jgi:WD40 repeat protein
MARWWFCAAGLLVPALARPGAEGDKPQLVLDARGHTAAISAVLVTPDGREVITASEDKTVRIWDVAGGMTKRVLRPPLGPGDQGELYAAALSPDGKTLAVAGWGLIAGGQRSVPIYLIALPEGRIDAALRGHTDSVRVLAFSPDGKRLASGAEDSTVRVWDVAAHKCEQTLRGHAGPVYAAAFSPDGKRLVSGGGVKIARADYGVRIWDLEKGKELRKLPGHHTAVTGLGWGRRKDGTEVLASCDEDGVLYFWDPNREKERLKADRAAGRRVSLHWQSLVLTPDAAAALLTGHVGGGEGRIELLDTATGKVLQELPRLTHAVTRSALSADGTLLATAGSVLVRVWKAEQGLGSAGPEPRDHASLTGLGHGYEAVGWAHVKTARDDKTSRLDMVVAWTNASRPGRKARPRPGQSFNPVELQLGPGPSDFLPGERRRLGELAIKPRPDHRSQALVHTVGTKRGGVPLVPPTKYRLRASTLLPGSRAVLANAVGLFAFDATTGKPLERDKFACHIGVTALAVSPGDRFLLASCNDQTLRIYNVDDGALLLSLFTAENEWVAWTPEGYYACSPGGERLMGWYVSNGPDALGTFYPAAQFKASLYRPEVISQLLRTGSLKEALAEADKERPGTPTAVVEVAEVLPPEVTLKAPAVKDGQVREAVLEVKTTARGKGKHPVKSLQLLLDGRPYPGSQARFPGAKAGAEVANTWKIELPEGEHTLRVVARTEASTGFSDDLEVNFAREAPRPRLFLLSIGIDAYADKNLKLDCAVNDAQELARTFTDKAAALFKVQSKVLTDKEATREGIEAELKWLRANVQPHDVTVVFYAGHGEREDKSFYLLPQDVNTKDLNKTGISGDVLKQHLATLRGRVLLLLDACHSGAVGRVINDLARDLADDDCGVIVMCAALGQEKAQEAEGHGFFCRALIEGLRGERQAPRNPRDGYVYLHHLEQYVIDRVQDLSKDAQHPTTARPTLRPLPLAKP